MATPPNDPDSALSAGFGAVPKGEPEPGPAEPTHSAPVTPPASDEPPESAEQSASSDISDASDTDDAPESSADAPEAAESPDLVEPVDPADPAEGDDGGEEPPLLVQRGEEGFPEPPEDIVAAAKVAPDHWLNVVDQHWEPADGQAPPFWARLGRWRSNEHGEIVEWEHNPEYRPSPERLGWPKPDGAVDAAVQRAATGYGPEAAVAETMAGSEVAVCLDEEGEPARSEAPDGTLAVAVFTPGAQMPEGQETPRHEVMPVERLLDQLEDGEEVLYLSSTAPVAQLVDPAALRGAEREKDGQPAAG